MPTTFTKILLSGSTAGEPIDLASTSVETTIHTAANATSTVDEVWLWAANTTTANQMLRVQYGSTLATKRSQQTIPAQGGWILVAAGVIMSSGVISALSTATASDVHIMGYVNRILQT